VVTAAVGATTAAAGALRAEFSLPGADVRTWKAE